MKTPYVNAVGIAVYPEGYSTASRRAPLWLRMVAALLLVSLVVVMVTTTVASLGGYCLTSDGGDTRRLHDRSGAASPNLSIVPPGRTD
jgi:hypothetical protein